MKLLTATQLLALLFLLLGFTMARFAYYPELAEGLEEGGILLALISLASSLLNYLAHRHDDMNDA